MSKTTILMLAVAAVVGYLIYSGKLKFPSGKAVPTGNVMPRVSSGSAGVEGGAGMSQQQRLEQLAFGVADKQINSLMGQIGFA